MNKFKYFLMSLILIPCIFSLFACGGDNDGLTFPSYYPTVPDSAITIENSTQLTNAINNQQDNQFWLIKEGIYNLDPTKTTKIEYNNQSNYYFPIVKNNITIVGIGNVKITSNIETANGSHNTQNFLTITGNNVSLYNLNIISKKEVNKVAEVFGKNLTLVDINFNTPTDYNFSGTLMFSKGGCEDTDIGTIKLKNVFINKGRISFQESATEGTINFDNVTIDFVGVDEEVRELAPVWKLLKDYSGASKQIEVTGANNLTIKIKASEFENLDDITAEFPGGCKTIYVEENV